MDDVELGEVTRWLGCWRAGDPAALDHLLPILYDELKRVARGQLRREHQPHTLGATALVHELYLRLVTRRQVGVADRGSFLAVAAVTMRRILVDHARRRLRGKRGGGAPLVGVDDLDELPLLTEVEVAEVIAIDVALSRLASLDAQAVRVVECRIFGGLTVAETASALELSERTVHRSWAFASAWLRQQVGASGPSETARLLDS